VFLSTEKGTTSFVVVVVWLYSTVRLPFAVQPMPDAIRVSPRELQDMRVMRRSIQPSPIARPRSRSLLTAANVERRQATHGKGSVWLDASVRDLFFDQPDALGSKVQ